MASFHDPAPFDAGIERLLTSLAGVISARVVADPDGQIEEIHILATPALQPKQVVRNVESALSAGLGILIDRRIVSVAQIRADAATFAHQAAATPEPPAPVTLEGPEPDRLPAAPFAISGQLRVVFLGYDARVDASRQASTRVMLRYGPDDFSGEGHGHDTVKGRAEAAARALFAALAACRGTDRLGLEGVALLEAHGRSYILVSARAMRGRRSLPLTGVAPLLQSPEEAAILAALQATNRWRAAL